MASICALPSLYMGEAGCGLQEAKQRSISDLMATSAEVVDGIFPRINSWAERGLVQEIQGFGLGFWRIRRVCCVHIMWMGSRQGGIIRGQVDRPKSVGFIFCANVGCDPIDDDTNIFSIK